MSNDPPKLNPDALRSRVRQTLVLLLWQQPATASKLQEVINAPRKLLDYHLKVLVNERWLEVERMGEDLVYRAAPHAHHSFPIGSGNRERVLALSLLDATWATLGSSLDVPLIAVWKTYAVDDVGLAEASEIFRDCLTRLGRVVTESSKRRERGHKGKAHQIVAVASLVPVEEPEQPGGD